MTPSQRQYGARVLVNVSFAWFAKGTDEDQRDVHELVADLLGLQEEPASVLETQSVVEAELQGEFWLGEATRQ